MKNKVKNRLREVNYFEYLLGSLSSMFEWDTDLDPHYIENYLHVSASFAAQPSSQVPEGHIIVPEPARVGELDQYGDGQTIEGYTRADGYFLHGTNGKDVVICYNNSMRTSDFDMFQYANYLSQVDKSMMTTVKIAGLAPLMTATDSKTAAAINERMTKLLDGDPYAITSENVMKALSSYSGEDVASIDVTNPERIRYTQYMSMLWDDLFKRFFNKYGLNIQNVNKQAQTSEDEVHGFDCVSWILPLDMLKCRQKFCEDYNRLFGTNWSVDFAEPWKQEYEAYILRKKVEDVDTEIEQERSEEHAEAETSEDAESDGGDA